ncbi:MAG: hypothetical protein DWC03_02395 [Candidatus Poseidoniales archaeon]|nr:MAG: hypothetical protein DWC03_02395 [Candidatus Poseidoniales archaeon]
MCLAELHRSSRLITKAKAITPAVANITTNGLSLLISSSNKETHGGKAATKRGFFESQQHPSHEQETPHGLQEQHSQGMIVLQLDNKLRLGNY